MSKETNVSKEISKVTLYVLEKWGTDKAKMDAATEILLAFKKYPSRVLAAVMSDMQSSVNYRGCNKSDLLQSMFVGTSYAATVFSRIDFDGKAFAFCCAKKVKDAEQSKLDAERRSAEMASRQKEAAAKKARLLSIVETMRFVQSSVPKVDRDFLFDWIENHLNAGKL